MNPLARHLSLLLLLLLAAACCPAATVTINPGQSIQAAIDAATNGDTIIVQPGTYTVNLNFAGKNITLRSSNPDSGSIVEQTILDGGAAGSVVTFDHAEGAGAVLDGFTIRNGKAPLGAGIHCTGASPVISHNEITENHAQTTGVTGKGGGLMVSGGNPTITRNTFSDNSADILGGGLYLANCGGTMEWNLVTFNEAQDGAGLALNNVTASFASVTINAGAASRNGGAMWLGGTNNAPMSHLFIENSSALRGGGLYCAGAGNAAPITNSIFTDNTADEGGGVYVGAGNLTLQLDTVVGNSSGCHFAGGVSVVNSSIIAFSNAGPGVTKTGGTATVKYCDLWSNSGGGFVGMTAGTGCLAADPLFVDWQSGLTWLKSQGGRYYLGWHYDEVTSPCIDAGDPALDFSQERLPNGGRVNMGDNGNTDSASCTFISMLSSFTPAAGAAGVNRRGAVILAFREAMKQASVQGKFSLTPEGGSAVSGTFSWRTAKRVVYFKPTAPLLPGTEYTLRLEAGILRNDDTAVPWSETYSFTTGNQPVVVTATPTGGGVARASNLVLTFDVGMNHASVENNLTLTPNVACAYAWAPGSKQLTVNPSSNLAAGTQYTAKLAAAARSAAGVGMQFPFSWSFTTGSSAPPRVAAAATSTCSGGAEVVVLLDSPARVSATILNPAGRAVASLAERELPAGTSSLLWDGRGARGSKTPRGLYLVRLCARDAAGGSSTAIAPLQR